VGTGTTFTQFIAIKESEVVVWDWVKLCDAIPAGGTGAHNHASQNPGYVLEVALSGFI
jgi:hypothetical protein